MSVQNRRYTLLVCSDCGKQAEVDTDGYERRGCPHYTRPLVTIDLVGEWVTDPTTYGLGRHGLILKPSAHIVPPPGPPL